MSIEEPPRRKSLVERLGFKPKAKKSQGKLRKQPPSEYAAPSIQSREEESVPIPWTLEAHRQKYKDQNIDTQLGERGDHTVLLHGITHRGSFDSSRDVSGEDLLDERPSGDEFIARVPGDVWDMIIDYLSPVDAANLAFTSKTCLRTIGYKPWSRLDRQENYRYRIEFLLPMDRHLPYHLFCFPCACYHFRIQPGNERLKKPDIPNPIFDCPNARNPLLKPPKARLTAGRELPFTFLQLALRAHRYLPEYGISVDSMSRRWKEDGHGWMHSSRYLIHNGHLLVRVTSSQYTRANLQLSEKRMLLFSREDYTPYFSACAHWRHGELLDLCKCALDHIPAPRDTSGPQGLANKVKDRLDGRAYDPNSLVSLCGNCQPMRRCPQCPSEYLIEIRLLEDKAEKCFKRAIVVTRWTDLGDETMSREWKACAGQIEDYDSFAEIGKRAVSGVFESAFTKEQIPGQRMLSLNPTGKVTDEDKDAWY